MPRNAGAKPTGPTVHTTIEMPPPEKHEARVDEAEKLNFWERMLRIPAEEWGKPYTIYLYRDSPKVRIAGQGGYLCQLAQPFTPEDVRARYGGGTFRAMLLKGSELVATHTWEIEGLPKYDLTREDPSGAGRTTEGQGSNLEVRLLDMLQKNLEEMKSELRRREASGGDPAFQKAVEIMDTAYKAGIGAIQKEQVNPTALLKDLVSTAKEMGLMGGNGNGDAGIVGTIRVLKELGLIGQMATPQNPLEQLNLFLGIFEKIDELRGEGGGRRRRGDADWKETLANKFGDALPTILERMGQPRARPGARPGVAAQPPQRPSVPANPQPIVHTAASAPGARPVPPIRPAPAATGLRVVSEEESAAKDTTENGRVTDEVPANPPVAAAEQISAEQLAAIEEQAYFVGVKRRVLKAVMDGDEGSLIADFLELAWPQMVNYLESFSAEQVTNFLANDPILGEAVQHPNWPIVLKQAQQYLAEDLPAERVPN